jgi:4-amino-4-deoxy-L-arabinose transferase-like glycosyltransferase
VISIRAMVEALKVSMAEWKVRVNPKRYLGHSRAGDAFPEFLVIWALFPILFFTFSKSKLPGYILPSIPPVTILTGDYLNRIRRTGLPTWLLWAHAAVCAAVTFVLVLAPQHMVYETLVPSAAWLACASAAALLVLFAVARTIRIGGIGQVRNATLFPVLAALVFLLGFHGKDLDVNYSARPLAREMQQQAPGAKLVAFQDVRRDMIYGLAFYRNQQPIDYCEPTSKPHLNEEDCSAGTDIPAAEHLLVIPANETAKLEQWLPGRVYEPLFLYESQGLAVYKVYAKR